MTEKRLKEIEDSINLQLELCKQLKVDDEMLQEEKELHDYTVNLLKKYNKALELLEEYGMPCERDNFNLLDTDYCEINCSNDEEQFKKCWNEFIEWRLKDG